MKCYKDVKPPIFDVSGSEGFINVDDIRVYNGFTGA